MAAISDVSRFVMVPKRLTNFDRCHGQLLPRLKRNELTYPACRSTSLLYPLFIIK